MIIFFSHSLTTYGTDIESRCLAFLKSQHPNSEIINPHLIEIKESIDTSEEFERVMRLYILPIVRSCDLLAYYKDDGYSPGVDMEVAEAERLHIPVKKVEA